MKKIILLLMMSVGYVSGACKCECIDGHVEALCQNSLDLKPICPQKICPLTAPSIAPLQTPKLPPLGTSSCFQAQVYDEEKRRYEWREICR